MMPEDVMHDYAEVTDNDGITGPKSAQSKTYTVRLPSLDEMIAEFESERDADLTALDKILEGEREMAQKIEELRRELAHDQQIDWEKQKNLEELASQGQRLEKELNEIAENMQQQLEQAQKQKLQSLEMLQKMAEAQQLFNEVATEEMKEAMRKLQEAMEQLDQREVQQALAEMELSQEEMNKRLDRTIEYLKRLQAEQKVDTFVRRLEEMLAQQNALNEESKGSESEQLPNLGPSQERLKSDFEDLAAEMAAAESLLTANEIAPEEMVKQFCQSAQQSPAPSHMEKSAQGMNQQNKDQAQKEGGASSESLSDLLEEMKEFQEQMASKMKEKLAKQLREALDKVFYLSEEQEDLLSQSEQLDPNSLSLRDMAAEQEALRAATERLSQEVAEMSKKSSCLSGQLGQCLSNSMGRMQSSAQSLSERRGSSASNSQRDAMFELNTAAQQIVEGMDKNSGQCQSPGTCDKPGSQGAMGQMKSLAQRQGRLNQEMPGSSEGGSMSMEERQALSRLKAEQQAIQQSVEQMHSEIGDDRSTLGRLDKLAEEMKRVVEAMERSEVSEETRERQRRIYTRMLDFQHSLEKQDFKDQRKARFGEDILRASPDQLDEMRGLTDEEYERLMTRYQEEGYPPEYEEVIREYFRALVEARGK
jgi:myosin heavy subunit